MLHLAPQEVQDLLEVLDRLALQDLLEVLDLLEKTVVLVERLLNILLKIRHLQAHQVILVLVKLK